MMNASRLADIFKTSLVVIASLVLVAWVLVLFLPFLMFTRVFALAILAVAAFFVGLGAIVLRGLGRSSASEHSQKPEHHGVRVPTDVVLHNDHIWERPTKDGTAIVGVDDLLARCIGPLDDVDLPPPGRKLKPGDTLFALRRGARRVVVQATAPGVVNLRNEAILARPKLVLASPYDLGWLVEVRPTHDDARFASRAIPESADARRLTRRGSTASAWFREEVDRLLGTVCPSGPMPAMPDGGVISPEFHTCIDDATWERVRRAFFGTR